jgi:hypothetical protein
MDRRSFGLAWPPPERSSAYRSRVRQCRERVSVSEWNEVAVKLTTVAVFGFGYVLGSRAGRERYAQIVAAARKASERLEAYSNGGGGSLDRSAIVGRYRSASSR